MNDIAGDFSALPILDPEREQYHKSVRSFQAHRVTDTQRRLRTWFWLAIVGFAMAGCLAASFPFLLPLKTILPLPVTIQEDGTADASVSLADLGDEQKAEKAIRATVWRYVLERESYSMANAKWRYDLVSFMSNENVQRDYQNWFLKSPDSPQKVYGKNGEISVRKISTVPVRENVFMIRFWRSAHLYGESEHRTSNTATLEFERMDAVPTQFSDDDVAGLRIVRYQVEENTP